MVPGSFSGPLPAPRRPASGWISPAFSPSFQACSAAVPPLPSVAAAAAAPPTACSGLLLPSDPSGPGPPPLLPGRPLCPTPRVCVGAGTSTKPVPSRSKIAEANSAWYCAPCHPIGLRGGTTLIPVPLGYCVGAHCVSRGWRGPQFCQSWISAPGLWFCSPPWASYSTPQLRLHEG